ncbi:glycosyltransferase [Helicobacter ganmani]|uniref:glycosyltransferase n=2 Tax=Helicobacter TaxID=209 RepID=UPI003A8B7A4A
MNQQNKKVAIVLAGDEKLDFAIANVIIGLKRYNESLIDRVFVYTDMPQEKRDKISLIWRDKIAFVAFGYEDFEREFSCATNEEIPECIAQDKRFGHHIYAKFYCFDLLRDYDYVIWLDSDVLVQNSIEDILAVDIDFKWGNGQRKQIEAYLSNFAEINEQEIAKPNGGVISFSKNILRKTSIPLRLECYKIVSCCYSLGVLSEVAMSDEIPFGIIAYEYHLSFAPLRVANIAPYSPHCSKDVAIIHAVSGSKFWSSAFSSLLFGEWYVNHKEWERISQQTKEFEYKKSNLPIENLGNLYGFLLSLHYLTPLILRLEKRIFGDSAYLYISPKLNGVVEIYSHLLIKEIFYCFVYKHHYGEWDISCELQLVVQRCKEEIKFDEFLLILQKIAQKTGLKQRIIKDKNNQIQQCVFMKNVNLKNVEECIQEFLFLKSVSFMPIYQHLFKENRESSRYETFFTATSRVQSHLSYQLGQILLKDSKSFFGISKLPFKILWTILKHKNKQKQYQEKITNNPCLKLPPLESYPDYKQALKIKNYFSYQLGEAFLTSISAGGGGDFSPLSAKCVS